MLALGILITVIIPIVFGIKDILFPHGLEDSYDREKRLRNKAK